MIIVPIKKSSIRKNPNYGKLPDPSVIFEQWSFKSNRKDFNGLVEGQDFIVTSYTIGSEITEYEGVFTRRLTQKEAIGIQDGLPGTSIMINRKYSEPLYPDGKKYLYDYEEISIKCNDCKCVVLATERIVMLEDFGWVDICPKCKEYDSFPDWKLERIEDCFLEKES